MANNSQDVRLDSFLKSVDAARSNGSPDQLEEFWSHEEIDAARWNQIFPYQLLLVKRDDGDYVQDNEARQWVYTLPFPPESLSISMPPAIAGSVTQGGYHEEHNGAPLRMISLSGTTGVLPFRPTADVRNEPSLAQAIFGGTIQQANRVATSAYNVQGDITGVNSSQPPNLVDYTIFEDAEQDNTGIAKTSGYYQFRVMMDFFENYLNFKKTKAGRDYRLALAIWKQQAVYLVTPMGFTASQNANSPYEYTYNLSFKAWRRVTLDQTVSPSPANFYQPIVQNVNRLSSSLKAIQDARDVLENARDIVSSVAGDIDRALFEPIRQLSLFLKDTLSVPLAFADLPVQVLNSCQTAVLQYMSTTRAFGSAEDTFAAEGQSVVDAYEQVASLVAEAGLTGAGPQSATPSSVAAHPALDIFTRPSEYYNLYKNIQPGKVNLSPVSVRAIQTERDKIRTLKRLNFEQIRDGLVQFQADFADAVGAGNATFNKTYRRVASATKQKPSPADFRVLFALNRVVIEANRLAASGTVNQTLSSVDFLAGLASRSGMAFNTPRSKFAVPMPYGITLEKLADRYLGNPDRWIEIVALNGLRAPYIDEEGFDLPLLVNGKTNDVIVGDASNLYLGQKVWLVSTATTQTSRHIVEIRNLPDGTAVITLDGDPDLSRFGVSGSATLHAYLPDTVNSQMMLYIPSDQASSVNDEQLKAIPGIDQYDQLLNVGGIDLLLTSTGDLAVTPDGDCRLAVGLNNIIQTARIRLSVMRGELNRHPSFGLPVKIGQSTADLNAKDLLKATKNLFADDPTFTGVSSASVRKSGPGVQIALSIGVAGQSQNIPITLDLV